MGKQMYTDRRGKRQARLAELNDGSAMSTTSANTSPKQHKKPTSAGKGLTSKGSATASSSPSEEMPSASQAGPESQQAPKNPAKGSETEDPPTQSDLGLSQDELGGASTDGEVQDAPLSNRVEPHVPSIPLSPAPTIPYGQDTPPRESPPPRDFHSMQEEAHKRVQQLKEKLHQRHLLEELQAQEEELRRQLNLPLPSSGSSLQLSVDPPGSPSARSAKGSSSQDGKPGRKRAALSAPEAPNSPHPV